MRFGFTTGSCGAAAAKAAAYMLLTGDRIDNISIMTPKGIVYDACIEDVSVSEDYVCCAVRKDAGDDPDVTDGMLIYAKAQIAEDKEDRWTDKEQTNKVDLAKGQADKEQTNKVDLVKGWTDKEQTNKVDFVKGWTDKEQTNKADFVKERTDKEETDKEQTYKEQLGKEQTYKERIDKEKTDWGSREDRVIIKGGKGIGVVTKPGLDRAVGEAAINTVPLKMIRDEVLNVCEKEGFEGSIIITIYAPEGERIAEKTFNSRLGIKGGISIIGTTGIVKPMSSEAIIETIKLELSQKKALGIKEIYICPGNYGLSYLERNLKDISDKVVICSNYPGEALDCALSMDFERIGLVGHLGKFIKLSGGIFYTHSEAGDCRMELLGAAAIRAGVEEKVVRDVLDCVNTEGAVSIIKERCPGKYQPVMDQITNRIMYHIRQRIIKKGFPEDYFKRVSCRTFLFDD